MKKCLALLLSLFSLTALTQAQKVIIGGAEGARPLVWTDFTGAADATSPYHANTKWNLRYQTGTVQFRGDSTLMPDFAITLELSGDGSWVKKGKETPELLRHEQGHFDLGRICMAELLAAVKKLTLTPDNFKPSMQGLFQRTMARYHDMGTRYDAETVHGTNKEAQEKWNGFFAEQLLKWSQ